MKHLQDSHIYRLNLIIILYNKVLWFYILLIVCLELINFNIKGLVTHVW